MRIDILTVFPQMFEGPLTESIIKRAADKGLITINVHDIRAFATDRHRTTDDYPYGGGAGMVMKPEPIFAAVEAVLQAGRATPEPGAAPNPAIILTSPSGRLFSQAIAEELARESWLIFICGHYEGVDERVREHLVTDEISIGDYVLTGGELPAMVIVDAVARLVPGVLSAESIAEESFSQGLLEYPQYTRPPEFRGWRIPDMLLSGHHAEIAKWRRRQALRRTFERRPDLLETAPLTEAERRLVEEWKTGGAT